MSVVHEDYDRAGADVIITNTFPTSRHVLEPAGLGDRFRESTTLAGELAKPSRESAARHEVYIAGSISTVPPATTTRCSRRRYGYGPTKRSRRRCWRRPGGPDRPGDTVGRGAGDLRRGGCGDGLPAWAGFLCKRREDGAVVLWIAENTLAEALQEVPLSYVSMICVLHTLVEDASAVLGGVMSTWSRPVGAYPHAGRFVTPN